MSLLWNLFEFSFQQTWKLWITTLRETRSTCRRLLHLVEALSNATQSINYQVVRWEENILKNEPAAGFWRKSGRFVKVVYPSASERGFFHLFLLAGGGFWGGFGASQGYLSYSVLSLPQSDFWFPLLSFNEKYLPILWGPLSLRTVSI